ncbi:DnaJ family domain-containing protein [Quatrionicoccus australiensis]|uniref:DnaJ family domain-containing protein n=1 Tax=Quatrionicoccus australiensis TaxID=138118 RepID=UPI001CF89DD2|nr:DUF1992 domain-containing protein [Quatrionicoccus australiensis]UCV16530.1 DUF1992 domain-containing protein [Quatrionicoccus australiensis]
MSTIFDILAERRIGEAVARGELDDLPGAGQPLLFEDEPFVTPEQRMVNRVLKNAGFTPREVLLRKEVAELRRRVEETQPGERREQLKKELVFLLIQVAGNRGA